MVKRKAKSSKFQRNVEEVTEQKGVMSEQRAMILNRKQRPLDTVTNKGICTRENSVTVEISQNVSTETFDEKYDGKDYSQKEK